MATSGPPPAAFTRRRFTRMGGAVTAVATVVALWLGLSAPGVSPVAPAPTAEQATTSTTQQTGTDETVTLVHHHHSHR